MQVSLQMNSNNAQFSNCMCSYCENSYNDPRILSCLHSYCLQCITKIHVQDIPSITCPSCNHLTPIPVKGVASLPLNSRFKEGARQDKLLQRIISSPSVCDSCEEDSSVSVAYCKDCDDLLCQECWDIHRKIKVTRSHTTIATKDFKNRQIEQSKTPLFSASSSEVCPNHKMDFGFYCKQCAVLVCGGCGFEKHSNHSTAVLKISEQVVQTKKEILQNTKEFPEKNTQLEKLIRAINEAKKKLKVCKEKVDSIIQETFCRLRQLIDQREKALLAENSEISTGKETRLSIQQESLQHLLESMSHCHSLASIATGQYTDVQLLSISQTLQDRAVTLQKQFTDTSLNLSETPDISVKVNTDALAQMITEFGGVADSSLYNSNAVVPRQKLGIRAEMKVKVTTRDNSGRELNNGRSVVRGILTGSGQERVECPVSNNGDGTYLVSVIPQQLGQHHLSITVNSQCIQGSPFKLSVVAQRDYTKLKYPVQTITGINSPVFIAFTDNGDIFVTSETEHCIHVYDSSGKKKTTIGSEGSGELQFNEPQGIAITGDVIYVAEFRGNRIHKLTTGGEFLGTFGESGYVIGQFDGPFDIKIIPDGKVYVADRGNSRVQVFHPD